MKLSVEEQILLGLTKREQLVLRSLEKLGQASMQQLAEHIKLPRTSLYWPLMQLYGRNLVAYELRGKRKYWYSRVGESIFRQKLGALESITGDMRIVEGVENIRALYRSALDLHKTERVLLLEGNRAVHSVTKKFGLAYMLQWHKEAQKRDIILESIVGEKVYENLGQNRINKEIIKSLANFKLWIGYVVPDSFIETDVALMLFRDTAIITDWQTERSVVINTPETVRLLRGFCSALQTAGKKVDIASYVRQAARSLP